MITKRYQAQVLADNIIKQHNLFGWTFEISDDLKSKLAHTDLEAKRVTIGGFMFKVCPREIDNVIKHEYAHALSGETNSHDKRWKTWANRLGASTNVYYENRQELEDRNENYVTRCTKCNKEVKRSFNMPNKKFLAKKSPCCREEVKAVCLDLSGKRERLFNLHKQLQAEKGLV